MQARRLRHRVVAALVVAVLALLADLPAAAAGSVPPPAPAPTDRGNSPEVPDPHPPRGGLDAKGRAVGGAAMLSRGLVLPAGAPPLPKHLTAQSWVLSDLDTGAVIAARDPHGRYQPASIQKILTAVALLPRLPGSQVVTVSRSAADTEGSHAGLVAGGRYTVDQIFEGLLLVSGNDAAEALAQAAGGRTATVGLMNRTALGLGAVDTLVQTPSGLDGWRQLTSAYDMTVFLRAAAAMPRFTAYDRTRTLVLPRQRHVGAVRLINQNLDFLDGITGAVAAKTGFTDAAQHTFAGIITRHGRRYGVILLRAQRYPEDQYVQAARLVRWALSLPAGTRAVGRLPAVTRPSVAPATSVRPTPPASPPRAAAAARAGARHSMSGIRISVAAAVALLAALFLLARLRRARSARRG